MTCTVKEGVFAVVELPSGSGVGKFFARDELGQMSVCNVWPITCGLINSARAMSDVVEFSICFTPHPTYLNYNPNAKQPTYDPRDAITIPKLSVGHDEPPATDGITVTYSESTDMIFSQAEQRCIREWMKLMKKGS